MIINIPYYQFYSNDKLELEFYKLAEKFNARQGDLYQLSHCMIGIVNLFESRTGIRMRKPRIVK
jgi:hypothetical protein